MPKEGEMLKYKSGIKSMKAPFIIVADIESLLVQMIQINHQQIK